MSDPKITIKMKESSLVEREALVTNHALIQPWIVRGSECKKCGIEFKDDGRLILAVDSDRGIFFLHTACYDRIIIY